jgi:hypothetical protein
LWTPVAIGDEPVVESMSPAPAFWTCSASVVDDRTNDATYVLPVAP